MQINKYAFSFIPDIVCDESVILLSENLLSLEVIDLSWNSSESKRTTLFFISKTKKYFCNFSTFDDFDGKDK